MQEQEVSVRMLAVSTALPRDPTDRPPVILVHGSANSNEVRVALPFGPKLLRVEGSEVEGHASIPEQKSLLRRLSHFARLSNSYTP